MIKKTQQTADPMGEGIEGMQAAALLAFLQKYPETRLMVRDARTGVECALRVSPEHRQLQASDDGRNFLAVAANRGRFKLTEASLADFRKKTLEDELARAPLAQEASYLDEYLEQGRLNQKAAIVDAIVRILDCRSERRMNWSQWQAAIYFTLSAEEAENFQLFNEPHAERSQEPINNTSAFRMSGVKQRVLDILEKKDIRTDIMRIYNEAQDIHVFYSPESKLIVIQAVGGGDSSNYEP